MSAPPFDIQRLLDPAAYPWPVDEVRLIETHISWVLLAGDKVVKLKRPVDLGFVDFRDPATRKQACEDEVRLNRRLTTDVYLGVVPVTANGVDAAGEPLEWATLMRRMPADRMLDVLLREDAAPDDLAQRLADRLIPFHQSSFHPIVILNEVKDLSRSDAPDNPPTEEQAFASARGEILRVAQNDNGGRSEPGTGSRATRGPSAAVGTTGVAVGTTKCPADPDVYLTVLTDNLDQVAEAAGDILGLAQLALVDRSMRRYLTAERELLETRLKTWLGEGHGDLRCEHICLEPDAMQIYDCVEFEIAIRCADVASDLAFLLMDLRRLGAGSVAAELLERYRAAGFDLPQPVVDLYAAHRALVRAKVAALERSGGDADRDRVFAFEAASYLDLATTFATPVAPVLVLVSGLSGSGKSTVAAAIARATGGTVFASDRVRKELAGLAATTSAAAEWHQGIYAADWTERTYDRLLALATAELKRKRTAVVDATFLDNDQRERFAAAARERGIPVAIVWTELDDEVARQRLERRARERNDPSDASMQIREHQQKLLRDIPLRIPEGALAATVDTGVDGPASLDPLLTVLDAAGSIGALLPDRTMSRA